jgi:hypothetical protein
MAVLVARAAGERQEGMAETASPERLGRHQVLLAGPVAMAATGALAALVEMAVPAARHVASACLVPTATVATVGMAATPAKVATVAMVPLAMRPRPTAALAASVAIRAQQQRAAWVAWSVLGASAAIVA